MQRAGWIMTAIVVGSCSSKSDPTDTGTPPHTATESESGDTDSGDTDSGDPSGTDSGTPGTDSGTSGTDSGSADSGKATGDSRPEGSIALQDATAKLSAEGDGDKVGYSVSTLGDVDGDGWDDIIVGATFHDDKGAAYVVHGPISGETSLSEAQAKLSGNHTDDQAGIRVTSVGDVNQDGVPDMMVGASGVDDGGIDAGAAYLFLGPVSGNLSMSEADATFVGAMPNSNAGDGMDWLGDMDGDGHIDIAIAATLAESEFLAMGVVYLLAGPHTGTINLSAADAQLWGENAYDRAGNGMSGAGDLNGDGLADLLVGAPQLISSGEKHGGYIYVLMGPVSGEHSLADADWIIEGGSPEDHAGVDLSSNSDIDGDGTPDLFVGAHSVGKDQQGAAYVLWGPGTSSKTLADAPVVFEGERSMDWAGVRVAFAGDIDGDAVSDLLISSYHSDEAGKDAGRAYLVYGNPGEGTHALADADVVLTGEAAGDQAGMDVAAAGNVIGDGAGDFLIGARYEDSGGKDGGTVYIVQGGLD